VLQWAKRLYIFGLFEYGFFTIANHYAYLAVESAVYHRWNLALPRPTTLQHGSETLSLPQTGRGTIKLICLQRGWKRRKVKVNGRPYPDTVAPALDQLHEDRIINDWQFGRLKNVWMELRNSHSHLEFAPITGPTLDTIEKATELINTLFDSLGP